MKMTPALLVIGGLIIFWTSVFSIVILPPLVIKDKPSDIWRAWSPLEAEGHELYNRNGCSYCHTQYIRPQDWGIGAERVAQPGDYTSFQPIILGSERTGPDLSQEGGEHSDDWHLAHFINPRLTRLYSVMPAWQFLGGDKIRRLTAYMQSEGGRMADPRVARQKQWNEPAVKAYASGPHDNIEWIHSQVPEVWRAMPNPYPATEPALGRGKKVYQAFCIGCHGPVGDGKGPAEPYLNPPPLNFTILRDHLVENRYIGGIFYYQIMNGITGTAMPYFKKDLESEKIWDVSNYVAVYFLGYTDANLEPRGIDASYEPVWKNEYAPPKKEGTP